MDEHGLVRSLGWVSVGVGLAAVAAPGPLMRELGGVPGWVAKARHRLRAVLEEAAVPA